MLRDQADAGAETDAAGDGCGGAQGHEGIEPVGRCRHGELAALGVGILRVVPVEEDHVLAHPEGRESRGIGRAGDRPQGRRTRAPTDADRREADLHGYDSSVAAGRQDTPVPEIFALVCRMGYALRHDAR